MFCSGRRVFLFGWVGLAWRAMACVRVVFRRVGCGAGRAPRVRCGMQWSTPVLRAAGWCNAWLECVCAAKRRETRKSGRLDGVGVVREVVREVVWCRFFSFCGVAWLELGRLELGRLCVFVCALCCFLVGGWMFFRS